MRRLLLTRSPGRRPFARRAASILLATVALAAAAVVAVAAAGGASGSVHPLVASSLGQPAPAETATPDTTSESDGATVPEDVTSPDSTATASPSSDGVPGDSQGGSTAPAAASGPTVRIPILVYHYIRGNPVASDLEGYRLSVTPANFAQQMALLHADGVHTLSIGDVIEALRTGDKLPARSVVLTFDDGHDDFASRAVPVLQYYGFTATTFVVPGFLGKSSYMSLDQLESVVAAGMTVGAHTMHHVDLAAVAPAIAAEEISQSRTVLQDLTGQPVDDFAYPYGIFTGRVVAVVAEAGFSDASTTEPGTRQYASQPFLLRRTEVSGYDSLSTFAQKAGVPPPPRSWVAPSPSASASPSGSPSPTPTSSPSPATGACTPASSPQPVPDAGDPTAPATSQPRPSPCPTPSPPPRRSG